jgi:hypothetical protein
MLYITITGNKIYGNFGNNGNGLHIDFFCDKNWFKDHLLHRINGPATKYFDGDEEYYINGEYHRENGPAVNYKSISEWYLNGELHRLDGPAIIDDVEKRWYYNGDFIECNSQEEFERLIRLKVLW